MTPRFTRDEHEQVIHMLCDHYPKCFFEDPRKRLPLKKNIAADIVKDSNFQVDPDRITGAIEWYRSHISYDYALTAGVKRLDLSRRCGRHSNRGRSRNRQTGGLR
jgi:sRNA-binding protein